MLGNADHYLYRCVVLMLWYFFSLYMFIFFYEKLGVILVRNVLNKQMLKSCVCICVFCPAFRTWMLLLFYVNRIHGRGYNLCQSDSVSMFFGSSSSPALSPPPLCLYIIEFYDRRALYKSNIPLRIVRLHIILETLVVEYNARRIVKCAVLRHFSHT